MDVLQRLVIEEQYKWIEKSFYVVVFKSQVPPTTDQSLLGQLDDKSHEEAMTSGGLLK
jgi:UDP-glucose 6-dehydrogenase